MNATAAFNCRLTHYHRNYRRITKQLRKSHHLKIVMNIPVLETGISKQPKKMQNSQHQPEPESSDETLKPYGDFGRSQRRSKGSYQRKRTKKERSKKKKKKKKNLKRMKMPLYLKYCVRSSSVIRSSHALLVFARYYALDLLTTIGFADKINIIIKQTRNKKNTILLAK